MEQNEQNQTSGPELLVSWEVMNKMVHMRSKLWYFIMCSLALVMLVTAIVTSNLIFAIMIVLVVFIVIINDARPAQNIRFAIADQGIVIGNTLTPFRDLKSFYIVFDPPYVTGLYFERKNLGSDISVNLMEQHPVEIRALLLQLLPENVEKENEPRNDSLQKLLKL